MSGKNKDQIIKAQSQLIEMLQKELEDRDVQIKRWSDLSKVQERLIDSLINKGEL